MAAPVDDSRAESDAAVRDLAAVYAIDVTYDDWQGQRRTVSPATLVAVLAAFGVDAGDPQRCAAALQAHRRDRAARVLPPCVVLRRSRREVAVPAGAVRSARLELEDGSARDLGSVGGSSIVVPADVPLGYHRLIVATAGGEQAAHLLITPDRVPLPAVLDAPARGLWGLAVQLYSVRSAASWGIGDLGDLGRLARWSGAEHGADYVLVNPLHAAEVTAPMTASPYLPTTRRFANPLYLRVPDIAEYADLPAGARAAANERAASPGADDELLDRDAAWAAKRSALERVHALGLADERQRAFDAYCRREGGELDRFATWCALSEHHGPSWRSWPAPLRSPHSADVAAFVAEHAERIDFHRWLQWQLDEQLARAHRVARDAGMGIGVIHDVAVGVSPDGADAWSWQDVLASDVTVGAPPDAYSQLGQDWRQPPWRPDRLAELGYAPLRDVFRTMLRHCGGLRVDHVIGLFRLWWVPAGASAAEGTYVHYDHDALIGILALEAERAGAVIIGEDLGNVEPSARAYLAERGVFGTSILWFESADGAPLPPDRWRRDCLASVTTHDLPPTTGYLAGDHIRLRERLGLLTRSLDDELAADEHEKAGWVAELRRLGLLPAAGRPSVDDLVLALHAFLTLTPSLLRCVALVDAVGERRTQNQPGTDESQYPNWRVPLGGPGGAPVLLDDLVTDERVARVITAVRGPSVGEVAQASAEGTVFGS